MSTIFASFSYMYLFHNVDLSLSIVCIGSYSIYSRTTSDIDLQSFPFKIIHTVVVILFFSFFKVFIVIGFSIFITIFQ